MRITGGKYRGREIKSPRDPLTHPMGSREKLALFNTILPYLPEKRVLDAFAGSGALGLEALSRGARNVVFCEKSPKIAAIIKENIKILGTDAQTGVIISSVEKLEINEKFDVILVDPPYNKFDQSWVKNLTSLLNEKGIIVISHPDNIKLNLSNNNFALMSSRKYAAANISIFQKI